MGKDYGLREVGSSASTTVISMSSALIWKLIKRVMNTNRIRIKMCGTTNLADALIGLDLGRRPGKRRSSLSFFNGAVDFKIQRVDCQERASV